MTGANIYNWSSGMYKLFNMPNLSNESLESIANALLTKNSSVGLGTMGFTAEQNAYIQSLPVWAELNARGFY